MRKLWVPSLILLVVGIIAAPSALAGWFWNAQLDVQGTDVRLVWTVDDPDGADLYKAKIEFEYPEGAKVVLVNRMTDKERVKLEEDDDLSATRRGLEVQAEFKISPLKGADGHTASVSIVADGVVLASGTGPVGKEIKLSTTVPVSP